MWRRTMEEDVLEKPTEPELIYGEESCPIGPDKPDENGNKPHPTRRYGRDGNDLQCVHCGPFDKPAD